MKTDELLQSLWERFEMNLKRHVEIEWEKVRDRLLAHPKKLESLSLMEATGGEPDVIGYDSTVDRYVFMDCCSESPKERRSLCFDEEALLSRKEHKPKSSAVKMATSMGISIASEEEYRALQQLGEFDTKSSSWIATPIEIRTLGGALFADRRYNHVFVYHNGAESYYASRGFRGVLQV